MSLAIDEELRALYALKKRKRLDADSQLALDLQIDDLQAQQKRIKRETEETETYLKQIQPAASTLSSTSDGRREEVAADFRPEFWDRRQLADRETTLIDVEPDTSEFALVKNEFERDTSEGVRVWGTTNSVRQSRYRITRVQRIQNEQWRERYNVYRNHTAAENNGKANERMLFHGSKFTDRVLCESFDPRVASTTGSLGAGTYFATCSQTSLGYTAASGNGAKQLFLAHVTLGRVAKSCDKNSRRRPPPGRHSCGSDESGQFAIYDRAAAYPSYLITLAQRQ